MDRNWLYHQYIILKKSPYKIGEEIGKAPNTIRYQLKKHNIPIRNRTEAMSKELGNNWKGDKAKYFAKHFYMRKYKTKPDRCEICGEKKKLELSSKDHKYTRNVDEYQYICKSCHVKYDESKGFIKRDQNGRFI